MNRKAGVFVIFALILGALMFSSFVLAQEDQLGELREGAEKAGEFLEKERWEYLGEQWKELFLMNKFVSSVDSFLKKLDVVFFALLGEHYDLSLTLFFIIVLWIFFFAIYYEIIAAFSSFNWWTALAIGFLLAVISAHIGIYRIIAEPLLRLVFFFTSGLLIWFVAFLILLILLIIGFFGNSMSKDVRKKREEKEEKEEREKARLERKVFGKKAEGVSKAFEASGKELRKGRLGKS